jgi:cysteine synthase A
MDAHLRQRFAALERLIGNTPLVAFEFTFRGRPRRLFAKLESLNMTGSIKDRMALHILEQAYLDGAIRPGDTILEATSGNTGISFAALGRALGHPVTIFMPDWMSQERVALIEGFGAAIVPVSRAQGGFLGSIRLAEEAAARDPRTFLPQQFANVRAHERRTGPEIWEQLQALGRTPDAFVAGVGTGGTVMGVGRYLRSRKPDVRLHPLEPAESPTLSTGHKVGQHRIQGISDEFIPAIVDLKALDRIVQVADGDAILMARKLAHAGFAVGISSGANFLGALEILEELGGEATVVTVLCDSNKKYLSTDLFHEQRVHPDFRSPDVELTGFETVGRVCGVCDPAVPRSV